jgi:hypothetical protein
MPIRRANKSIFLLADQEAEIPTSGMEADRIYLAKDTGAIKMAVSSTTKISLGGAQGPQGPQGAQGPAGPASNDNLDGGTASSVYGGAITVEGGNANGN